jgi:hypothetical protein
VTSDVVGTIRVFKFSLVQTCSKNVQVHKTRRVAMTTLKFRKKRDEDYASAPGD